jgi:hypothetical protein
MVSSICWPRTCCSLCFKQSSWKMLIRKEQHAWSFTVWIGTLAWTAWVLAAAWIEWALNSIVSIPSRYICDFTQFAIVTGRTLKDVWLDCPHRRGILCGPLVGGYVWFCSRSKGAQAPHRAHLLFPNKTKERFFQVSFFWLTDHEGHRSRDVIMHRELDVSSLQLP